MDEYGELVIYWHPDMYNQQTGRWVSRRKVYIRYPYCAESEAQEIVNKHCSHLESKMVANLYFQFTIRKEMRYDTSQRV